MPRKVGKMDSNTKSAAKHTPDPRHPRPDFIVLDGTPMRIEIAGEGYSRIEAVVSNETACAIGAVHDLLEALEPFAALLQPHHDDLQDERPVFGVNGAVFTVGHLRRARAAIVKAKGGAL